MLCHLKYPLKAEIDAQGLGLWWEDTAISAGRGLENRYTFKDPKTKAHGPNPRTVTEEGFGRYSIEEQVGDSGFVFVWTLTLRENHSIDIEFRLRSKPEADPAGTFEKIEVAFCAAPLQAGWFTSADEGRFAAANDRDTAFTGRAVSFCLGLESAQAAAPSILFESLTNAAAPLMSFIRSTSDPETGARRTMGFVLTAEHLSGHSGRAPLMHGRIVASDRTDILKTFVNRNRSRSPLLHPWRSFFRQPAAARHVKTVLVNLPWLKDGISGVRAGSRWSHLKDESEDRYLPFPFFLSYAMALLTSCGYETLLLDAIARAMSEHEFYDWTRDCRPDLVVAEISTPSFENDLGMLARLPEGVQVALCGPVCMLEDKEFLNEYPQVDFILTNEYEESLLELVCALESASDLAAVKGLIWKDAEGRVRRNEKRPLTELNALPWPERETLPYFDYWDLVGDIPEPSAQMLSSRGCPYTCAFCLWPQLMFQGRNYRTRDPMDIVDEMEYLVHVLGYKSVYFDDDTTNIGPDRWTRICSEIIRRGLNRVPWAMMARADLMDAQLLSVFRAAGLHAVKYGVESTTQALVDNVCKQMDLKKAFRAIELTRDKNIKVHLTFMFGLPGETRETIDKTIRDALALNPHSVQFSINTPYPGTQIHKSLDAKGHIVHDGDYSRYDGHYNGVIQTENLSPTQLLDAKDRAYSLWKEHSRTRRGLADNVRRFFAYTRKYSLSRALKVVAVYVYSRLVLKGFFIYERVFWPLRDRSCTGITVHADRYLRGNVNSGRHPFGRGVIIDGGHNYAYAEYEFVAARRTEYNLYVKYANNGYRPVELYMDGVLIKKRALLEKTGGWNPAQALLSKELSITLDKGRHKLKVHSSGLIPHIHRFVLRAKDQDREVMNEFPEVLFSRVLHRLWDTAFVSGLRSLSPRRIISAFMNDLTEHAARADNQTALMLAGISQGEAALAGPEHAVIDLSNRCNQDCVGCWIHSPHITESQELKDWKRKQLATPVVKRLLDDLAQAGTKRVRFTGGGEPLVHPDIIEIISYARDKGMKTALTTNLALADRAVTDRLIRAGLDEISVSLWSATRKTFALTHPKSETRQFKQTLAALEYIASIPYSKPALALCFVINGTNVHELNDMYGLARNVNADMVYFTLMDALDSGATDELLLNPAQKAQAIKAARQIALDSKELGAPQLQFFEDGFLRRLDAADRDCDREKVANMPCYMGWYFTRILADGTVVPCCKAVDKKMGNVNERAFNDIWFGKEYNEFRWKAKNLPKTDPYFQQAKCFSQCDNLMHNLMIERMIDTSPTAG